MIRHQPITYWPIMKNLINLLTQDQVESAKAGRMVCLTNAAHGKQVIKAGYAVDKINSRTYFLTFALMRELSKFLNAHGSAVKVLSIQDKYSDNNGAYELLAVIDADGNEWSVNNMYDQSVCFRGMSESDLLVYADNNCQ